MWRVVMRPKLLRPPVLDLPSVSILTGAPLYRPLRSTSTSWRRPGLVGRNVLSAMAQSSLTLQARRHVDAVALFEGHDGALGVALARDDAPERLQLALAHLRVHRLHLDAEQLLDRRLDLRLARVPGHLENHLVVLRHHGGLLGDGRRDDQVVRILPLLGLAHLKRASSASSAALVSTSRLRRRMS